MRPAAHAALGVFIEDALVALKETENAEERLEEADNLEALAKRYELDVGERVEVIRDAWWWQQEEEDHEH